MEETLGGRGGESGLVTSPLEKRGPRRALNKKPRLGGREGLEDPWGKSGVPP